MKSKRITVNLKAHIKSVVDLEEKIKWANTPNITIPDMNYKSSLKQSVGLFNLLTRSLEKFIA